VSLTKPPEILIPQPVAPLAPPVTPPSPSDLLGESEWSAPPARSRRVSWRIILAVAVLSALALGGYAGVKRLLRPVSTPNMQLFQVTRRSFPIIMQEKGELKAASIIDIRCELEGKSTIIYLVPEGSNVKKGDLLVELASDEITAKIRDGEIKVAIARAAHEAAIKEFQILKDKNQSEIDKAELALWLARNAVEKYNNGEAVELQQTNELALGKAKYVLEHAQKKLEDSRKLAEKGFITGLELQNDEFAVYQGKLELQKAELALKVMKEYTIPMARAEKESAVKEAEKALDRAKKAAEASEAKAAADLSAKYSELKLTEDLLAKLNDQKKKARNLAPADGLVVYYRDDHDEEPRIKIGAQVVERQKMIELPNTSQMKVSFRVHEAKIEQLKPGLFAKVEIEGFTGREFTGKVSRIAVLADSRQWFNRSLKEYETEVLLDGTFTELKPGTTARVHILVTELDRVLAVPVQSIFGKAGKYYVFVESNGKARPVEVKVGLSSTEYAEIKEGLQEGDVVRLAVDDDLKLLLPDGTGNAAEAEADDTPRRRPVPVATRPSVPQTRPAEPFDDGVATRPKP
jgi:HlyD family secretion protein